MNHWVSPSALISRYEAIEWLDQGKGTEQDVQANLVEIDRINRYLGGDRALLHHLIPRLARQQGRQFLVDLGTGSGLFLLRLAHWAEKQGLQLNILGLDWSARNLKASPLSRKPKPGRMLIQADAAHLPLDTGGVDYTISSLFMHHFSPEALKQVLRAAYETSVCGVIMSDLVRGWVPLMAFRLIQPFFAHNRLTRHDGALSIRRAYLPNELLDLAVQAGLPHPRIYTHFPWRMTLVVDK